MDPPPASSNGVSVPKYSSSTFMNTFFWYFFQALTVSSMLLMLLSIYWMAFASGSYIRDVCVITVAFAIISPTLIVPNLPQIASVAIPIVELNKYIFFQALNKGVWLFCGFLYPLPANLLCYSLMAGVGLLKLYSNGGSNSLRLNTLISGDAFGTSMFVFGNEMKYGTGRWLESSTGIALVGLFVVTLLAHYVPPLVNPEKMMNEIEAILTEVASEKKNKKVNVDHVVNVAEAPIPGSGTKSLLETVVD